MRFVVRFVPFITRGESIAYNQIIRLTTMERLPQNSKVIERKDQSEPPEASAAVSKGMNRQSSMLELMYQNRKRRFEGEKTTTKRTETSAPRILQSFSSSSNGFSREDSSKYFSRVEEEMSVISEKMSIKPQP